MSLIKSAIILEDLSEVRSWLVSVICSALPGVEVSEAATITEARLLMSQRSFDFAFIDIGIPDGDGINLIPTMREINPSILCIIVTIFDDDKNIFRALRAGAYGYLLKNQGRDRLRECLERILDGEPPLSPRIALRILNHFRQSAAPHTLQNTSQPILTNREQDVLTLIAKGLNRTEVATAFGISSQTVASHIGAIYRKLNITSRSEATIEAIRRGLIRT